MNLFNPNFFGSVSSSPESRTQQLEKSHYLQSSPGCINLEGSFHLYVRGRRMAKPKSGRSAVRR